MMPIQPKPTPKKKLPYPNVLFAVFSLVVVIILVSSNDLATQIVTGCVFVVVGSAYILR